MAEPMTQRDENRFWLQVMGDKARIMRKEMYSAETDLIRRAGEFIERFDTLLARATGSDDQSGVNSDAYSAVQDFRRFVLEIIRTQISLRSVISILPDYLDVYVNECEIYLSQLNAVINGQEFKVTALDVTVIWALNAYMGAIHLEDNISSVFVDYKKRAGNFADGFLYLYMRSQVLKGFMRTGLQTFPMLNDFYNDFAVFMTRYAEVVVDLIRMLEKRSFPGTLTLLDLDDLYRILCYIMAKLAEVSVVASPACDPAAPRRE